MKTAVLLAVALTFAGVAIAAAPTAAACPDPDNPCTPEPIDPLDCDGHNALREPVAYAKCMR